LSGTTLGVLLMEEEINTNPEETRSKRKKLGISLNQVNIPSSTNTIHNWILLYDDLEKKFNEASLYYQPRQVKETSLERIERKIDDLRKEVATRDDVIAQTKQILDHQEEINKSLQEKLNILRSMQESNVPHRRLAKYSIVFVMFFLFSFISRIFFDVIIVTSFWNNLGLLLSFGFFVMSLAMGLDWKQKIDNNN
jgi:hypothetical protein